MRGGSDALRQPLPAPDLPAVFAAGTASFAAAILARAVLECDVAVAANRLHIRFSDARLADALMGAFNYRRLERGGAPDLTILVWDSPVEQWVAPLLELIGPGSPHAGAMSFSAAGVVLHLRSWPAPTLQAIDMERRIGLYWTAAAMPIASGDRCRPFLPILHWLLADGPWQFVHASAVGYESGGVLLAGKGGSGKSTTALACARAGWRYAGDDFVLVDDAPEPRIDAIYSSARLRPDMTRHFPELARLRVVPNGAGDTDKHDFLLAQAVAMSAFSGFPLRAILVPRVGAAATALRPASRAEALRALAPSTLAHLKDVRRVFDKIARLAAAVPCFRLDLGPELDAIPAAIAQAVGIVR